LPILNLDLRIKAGVIFVFRVELWKAIFLKMKKYQNPLGGQIEAWVEPKYIELGGAHGDLFQAFS